MNIDYTTFCLTDDAANAIITKLNTKNEYVMIDKSYLNMTMAHNFTNDYIINQNIFKSKIILFMRDMINYVFNTNSNEILLPYNDLVKYFHPSNYTYAIDFLFDIGFIKKKMINYNDGGAIQYYQRPHNNKVGIATTYIITPCRQNQINFCLVSIPKKDVKKQFVNFKIDVAKTEKETLKNTRLNKKEAIKAEFNHYNNSEDKNINSLYKRINRILSFGEKIYTTRGNKSKRIFHNLSNLSSVSRKFLSYKGESFYNIDLKNSQIIFLVAHCLKNNLPVDDNFITLTLTGKIYDEFYGMGCGDDRKKVKQELFRTVFFDFKQKEIFNQEFKKMFPLAWATINDIHQQYKKDDKCNLAILMQNIEFDAFQNIPMISKAYFNLFDSIYCTSEADLDNIHNHLIKYFDAIGINNFAVTIND